MYSNSNDSSTLFAGLGKRVLCFPGTHRPFLPVGSQENMTKHQKALGSPWKECWPLLLVWFPHPVGHLWGKRLGDTYPFLRAVEAVQVGCRGVLCGWGVDEKGQRQWGCRNPPSILRSYCGRGKPTASLGGNGREKPFFMC